MRDALLNRTDRALTLDLGLWADPATSTELRILDALEGPVLDVGCGPGRLVAALRDRGVRVLGIDAAPSAIAHARSRGRRVTQRSVFDPIPREGSWATALLFDGNIGIGGAPTDLLRRIRDLITVDGCVVVELEPPGAPLEFGVVEFEVATGMVGWFPWCWVGADEIASLAASAGFRVEDARAVDGRWFARLRRRENESGVAE
jgi:SAM-dependent methyltransferase